MKDGLFKKYISTFGMTLISCTLLLGLALLYFSAKNFTDEKQTLLRNSAERAKNIAIAGVKFASPKYEIDPSVADGFGVMYDATGVTTYISDISGRVLLCSEGDECMHITGVSKQVIASTLKRGSYSNSGYFDGFFRSNGSYTYGEPLFKGDTVIGFVFVSLPITPLYSYLSDMMVTFLVSAGVMLFVAAVIIYFATRRLIFPLHEISVAAKDFGSGNFEARVPVTGSDEIAKLARSFNNMADSLTEFENMRRSFVANVSHELRTPMTTIGGYIDGILDNTIPPDKESHYLSIVSNEVKRLSRLTSSLLDITRIEEGAYTVNIVSCNVWEVILSVMGNAESRINDKNIVIPDLDATPKYALCDRDMLYQVIYNLTDNAIKFTPEHGTINVTATHGGGMIYIMVRNSGAGIKENEINHIFDRFYKIDKSRGLDRTGTGLGLYISKTLTQKMEGDLAAASVYGEYAEFTVSLKTGSVPEKNREPKSKPPRDTKKKSGTAQHTGSWFKKRGGSSET